MGSNPQPLPHHGIPIGGESSSIATGGESGCSILIIVQSSVVVIGGVGMGTTTDTSCLGVGQGQQQKISRKRPLVVDTQSHTIGNPISSATNTTNQSFAASDHTSQKIMKTTHESVNGSRTGSRTIVGNPIQALVKTKVISGTRAYGISMSPFKHSISSTSPDYQFRDYYEKYEHTKKENKEKKKAFHRVSLIEVVNEQPARNRVFLTYDPQKYMMEFMVVTPPAPTKD